MASHWSDNIEVAELFDEPAFTEDVVAITDRLSAVPVDQTPNVVLSLADVTYLNSSSISKLLTLRQRLVERGRQLTLCSVDEEIYEMLYTTGLTQILRFAPDTMTALAGLQLEEGA